MSESQPVDLPPNRCSDFWIPVPKSRNSGATGCVQIPLALGIDDVNAVSAHRHRQGCSKITMENVSQFVLHRLEQ
jgi:hypothetical protein